MSNLKFFPQKPDAFPIVYAYSDTRYPGTLKIGYTARNIMVRMKEHYPTIVPSQSWKVEWTATAVRPDGTSFTDKEIFKYLDKHHVENVASEWYRCDLEQVESAYIAVFECIDNNESRTQNFKMRPEQQKAVDKTIKYFENIKKEQSGATPKFLWNCKMRFGKTFTTYELAKKMGFSKILILTFKPAVESSWREDLYSHLDFEEWQFVSDKDAKEEKSRLDIDFEACDKSKPIVVFGSFQNLLGTNENGGIKAKNSFIHDINWDLVVFDEYHFGAWTENAKKLFTPQDEEKEIDNLIVDSNRPLELLDETWLPITANQYLYLSGTPFRAINSGEFIEEQVYNWTYSDEQFAKENWDVTKGPNPYAALPRIVLMTYKLPDSVISIAKNTELNEFDLNEFFNASGLGSNAKFNHENEVQKWLDIIRGDFTKTSINDGLSVFKGSSCLPFNDVSLLRVLNHTLWFLPSVASCFAMANLLKQRHNIFYSDYKINVCAGASAGVGIDALKPVLDSMQNPLISKTITLTCGKLTTGVTVRPWTGIFMLRNISTPETYFQSAFRVQSPWTMVDENGSMIVIKNECYIFDFSLNRALKQISDYSTKLDVTETNPEKKVADFINFLPVLAYQDGNMQQIDAGQILDIAMSGTTASLLARRWQSSLLVNVDNDTLQRVLNNSKAMAALMKIEEFRSLNKEISTIITKSEDVKKKKNCINEISNKEKKELSEEEREYKSKRKQIQERLIKFATRIPIFMYLTDYREFSLKDVITKLEPSLFKRVTGLEVDDFNLLVSLGIFNERIMDDAVYKFKRYEDSSFEYVGINKHFGENVGGYSTVITNEEYVKFYGDQQKSIFNSISTHKKLTTDLKENNAYMNSSKLLKNDNINVITPNITSKIVDNNSIKFDYSKIKIGTKVFHKAFGKGIVMDNDHNGHIKVVFDTGKLTKQFGIKYAFEKGFLTIDK